MGKYILVILSFFFCINPAMLAGMSVEELVYNPPRGEGKYILTPDAPEQPLINGPSRFGVRPGSPFLFAIPASGKRPIQFDASGLPAGLSVDRRTGHISGRIDSNEKRSYQVVLLAENDIGRDEKKFEIVVGDTIRLTPPLGWNSWNCWTHNVSQEKVLGTARAIVEKGLRDCGWSYVNIDDCWQGRRGGRHNAIMPNAKFPDMEGMCDQIHAMGLKVGIYSTPWITSYANFIGGSSDNEAGVWEEGMPRRHGEYKFDSQDARQWGDWGIDYLKYDWRPNEEESTIRMSDALRNAGRDIVYSLSNYAPLDKAELFHRLVNAYRTTGDIRDAWSSGAKDPGNFVGLLEIWDFHEKWAPYCSPGHYPDPDMLVVGDVGWGGTPYPSKLTADEQYLHISLWSLWSAPLLIGCPVEQMDEFTVKLLSNPEVLAVNQDPLCVMGRTSSEQDGATGLVVKPLADGAMAIGFFNKSETERKVAAHWSDLGINGPQRIRDLWRRRDIGVFDKDFSVIVPPHGIVLCRLGPEADEEPHAIWGMREFISAPKISPQPQALIEMPIKVEISADDGAEIRYTTDGRIPDAGSSIYRSPFRLRESAVVKAIALRGSTISEVGSSSFRARPPNPDLHLSDLDPLSATIGWGAIGRDKSCEGNTLTIAGKRYEKGIGTHADSRIVYALDPAYRRFVSIVGIDDEVTGDGSIIFEVKIDGKTAALTPVLRGRNAVDAIDIAIPRGSERLELLLHAAGDGKQYDHGDWADCGLIK